jgi:hypothetical protein
MKTQAKPTQPLRLLSQDDLRAKGVDYHPNHLRKLWQRGDFPKPIHLSPRRIAWNEQAVDEWILNLAKKQTAG